jgi:hydroxymethylglutaryl-CoA lyase
VDLARLVAAAQQLPALIGHDIPSQIAKAGRAWPAPGAGRL